MRHWETLACNRSKWREVCHFGVQHFEENRVAVEVEKRRRCKALAANSSSEDAAPSSNLILSLIHI